MGLNAGPLCHLYYKNIHFLQSIPNFGVYVTLHVLKIIPVYRPIPLEKNSTKPTDFRRRRRTQERRQRTQGRTIISLLVFSQSFERVVQWGTGSFPSYQLECYGRSSSAGIATGWTVRVRLPAEERDFFASHCPDRLWGPPSLLSNG
jgi:hypothetical protein